MPFIPDLIPEQHKVLPEHFNQRKAELLNPLTKFSAIDSVAIPFFIAAFANVGHIGVALLLAFKGVLWLSAGRRRLEQLGTFEMTVKLRVLFTLVLFCGLVPIYSSYIGADREEERQVELRREATLRFTADSLRKEDTRRANLVVMLKKSRSQDPEAALSLFKRADSLAVTGQEKDTLRVLRKQNTVRVIRRKMAGASYEAALLLAGEQLRDNPGDAELLLARAACYLKMGNVRLAVGDLDKAKGGGSQVAKRLYNKVNPLRRRVAYTITLCNDGSTSNASGRGACSWHGGVAEWNHPIYEGYRKY